MQNYVNVLQHLGNTEKRRCTKHASLNLDEQKQQQRTKWAKLGHIMIGTAIRQWHCQ